MAVVGFGTIIALASAGPMVGAASAQTPSLTWSNLTPPASNPGNVAALSAYDPATGQVILVNSMQYGNGTWAWNGSSWSLVASLATDQHPTSDLASLLAYDGATDQLVLVSANATFVWTGWSWDEVDAAAPDSLGGGTIGPGESIAFDSATGQLIVVAGAPDGTPPVDTSTWDWTGTTWTQLSPATSPPPSLSGSLAYDPADSLLVLFGGEGASGYLNDTWTWDGTTWTEQSPVTSPPARFAAAMAYDPATSQLVMFGGAGSPSGPGTTGTFDDTWTWDGTTWTAETTATTPIVTPDTFDFVASLSYDEQSSQLVLFAGETNGGQGPDVSDTWVWSGTDWSDLTPLPTSPAAGYSGSMAYDAATSQMMSVVDGQTFDWTGGTWVDLNPATSPPGYGLLAYDGATEQLIWFEQNAVPVNDSSTWSWDGTDWQQMSPPSSPPAVDGVANLAFDSSSGQLVLVGAFDTGATVAEQTWTWSGSTWSQQSPPVTPPALSDASMAYDPNSDELILFGGFTQATVPAVVEALTWAWNGSTWAQLSPAASPPPDVDGSFADDPAVGGLLLFGGQLCLGSCQNGSDLTWEWDGSTWTQLVFPQNPAARSQAGFGWDPATGQMLLSGGDDYDSALADTWVLSSLPAAAPQITSVIPGSGEVTISWTPPALSSGVVIGSYNITESPDGRSESVPGDFDSYVFTGLEQGLPYTFTIQPVNQEGTYPSSAPSNVVRPLGQSNPDEPTNVQATCGDQSATISWDAAVPSEGDGALMGYIVTGAGAPLTLGAEATSVVIPDLTDGSGPLIFFVAAQYTSVQTPGAESTSCTPYGSVGPPTLLNVQAGDQTATVSWSPAQPDAGVPIVGYEISYFNLATDTTTVGPDQTSAVVTDLTDGEGYFFTVSALTASGVGPPSATSLAVVPAPQSAAPDLTRAKASDQQVTLAWLSPASSEGGPVAGYKVSDSNGPSLFVGPSTTSTVVAGLSSGAKYSFAVAALTASGLGPSSNAVAVHVPVESPGAPLAVSAAAANRSVTVKWESPLSDGGATINGYVVTVYVCTHSSGTCAQKILKTATETAGTRKLAVRSLVNATRYWFAVTAKNKVGIGSPSAQMVATPLA